MEKGRKNTGYNERKRTAPASVRKSLQPGVYRPGTRLAPVFRTQQILNSDVGFASSIVKNWRAPNVPRTKYPGLTLACSHQL